MWLGPFLLFLVYTAIVLVLARRLARAHLACIALEIKLAQVESHRDRLAEILAHYDTPLELKDIRWVVGTRGLVLLTLN